MAETSSRDLKADKAVVALCTCGSTQEAEKLARGLVAKRLAACVNVLPSIRSIYRWREEIHADAEVLMIIKTSRSCSDAAQAWLQEHHSYEVPEFLVLPVKQGSPEYLDWLLQETGRE